MMPTGLFSSVACNALIDRFSGPGPAWLHVPLSPILISSVAGGPVLKLVSNRRTSLILYYNDGTRTPGQAYRVSSSRFLFAIGL